MLHKNFILGLIFYAFLCHNSFAGTLEKYQKSYSLMGSAFEIAVITDSETNANKTIEIAYNEIVRIEKLISSWDEKSETTLINNNAGIKPVKVSEELFKLIRRAKKVSGLSNGAFDISYASMDRLWKFDGTMTKLPSSDKITASVSKINYNNIILDETEYTVFLKMKGMKIGFGAIGKGYAANKARKLLKANGVASGMINAGGDMIAWGNGLNGEKWKVGIADPKKEKAYVSWLELNEMAVVTSGDYERYAMIDDVRYAHIIDPRTGYPAVGLKSVTIICPDAELADALATTIFVLGQEKGLELVNKLDAIECVIINDNNEILTSNTLKLNLQ